nr:DUF1328 domain-containing protein [uncultured Rhodopila sp.]
MLRLAVACLVISALAAVFGFGGVTTELDGIARIVFFIAIVLFVFLLVAGVTVGGELW